MNTQQTMEKANNDRILFQERIQKNYDEFYREWLSSSPDELIFESDQIAATQTVYNNVMDFIHDDEIGYLLRYENPLEILRDFWLDQSSVSIFDMKESIRNAVDSEEVPELYEWVDDAEENPMPLL